MNYKISILTCTLLATSHQAYAYNSYASGRYNDSTSLPTIEVNLDAIKRLHQSPTKKQNIPAPVQAETNPVLMPKEEAISAKETPRLEEGKNTAETPAPAVEKKSENVVSQQAEPVAAAAVPAPAPATVDNTTPNAPEPAAAEPEAVASTAAPAETPSDTTQNTDQLHGSVEVGANYHHLTHNPHWQGEYIKGNVTTDPNNQWSGELVHQKEFDDEGVYVALGNTHIFSEDWYSSVTLGTSTSGFFLPRYRLDAFLNKKWLEQKNFITTIGIGEYKARDAHEDQSLYFGASYYFEDPWIVEAGIRLNNSRPGNVFSTNQFAAVTYGRAKDKFITLRYGFGKEAYQAIGPNSFITDYRSKQLSLNVKYWINDEWGVNVLTEWYNNPYYDRVGITSGVFKEF